MTHTEIIVLIPSHSLEDFPTEMSERDAEGLLNAFAVVWHPLLLHNAENLPQWCRADDPPEEVEGKLILLPEISRDWLPDGWLEDTKAKGATLIEGIAERTELSQTLLATLNVSGEEEGTSADLDDNLVADFFALGVCYLYIELLTRHMHHFTELDEMQLQREAISAAKATIANDHEAARTHLTNCFEILTEQRERFYPVDCHLIDVCLLISRLADHHLEKRLSDDIPFNLIVSGEELAKIKETHPAIIQQIKKAWQEKIVDVCGGEFQESPSAMLPIESVLWQFQKGQQFFESEFDQVPTTWARRRFGLSPLMPQLLKKFGYHSALHILLDDGIYPDEEESKIQWEGCDGTVIDAISRIPLSADSASSFLRLPLRLSESMEEDQTAAIMLAHWPEVKSVFLEDLHRMHRYSPVLGCFVTFDEYFEHDEGPGRLVSHDATEYLSPYLLHSVAKREANPIGRFKDHLCRRSQFDASLWYAATAEILKGKPLPKNFLTDEETIIEAANPDGEEAATENANQLLEKLVPQSAQQLADVIMHNGGKQSGVLLLNSCSFARRAVVELPSLSSPPRIGGAVVATQFDEQHQLVMVDLPASGYVWLEEEPSSQSPLQQKLALAEENLLRNEFFEVFINELTGSISKLKGYGRSPNRISQQIAFRFPQKQTTGEEGEENQTYYSVMCCRESKVLSTGPLVGEIETTGEIINPTDSNVLSTYRQRIRVWKGKPIVEIEITLDTKHLPEGDPWSNYYAMRFAWSSSSAALTRSMQQGAHSFQGERFDSPWYFEIAEEEKRTTILSQGMPFYRKTGERMLDSILITEGETTRTFKYQIVVDQNYPMQSAVDFLSPVAVVPTSSGPPQAGNLGWFFHLNVKNVQIQRLLPLVNQSIEKNKLSEDEPIENQSSKNSNSFGFALRLVETEGLHRNVKLKTFRTPKVARQRDFRGETISELEINGDEICIEMTGYEICDVELRF